MEVQSVPGAPETDRVVSVGMRITVFIVGYEMVANGYTNVGRQIVPRTTAEHTVSPCCRAFRVHYTLKIIVRVPVRHPLPDIA